jgi:hypothetical protein
MGHEAFGQVAVGGLPVVVVLDLGGGVGNSSTAVQCSVFSFARATGLVDQFAFQYATVSASRGSIGTVAGHGPIFGNCPPNLVAMTSISSRTRSASGSARIARTQGAAISAGPH